MQYIMAEIVSGYDSEKTYNFDILDPLIMIGDKYPLSTDQLTNMKSQYNQKVSILRKTNYPNTNGQIVGYISHDELNHPLVYIDKRIMDCTQYTKTTNSGILVHSQYKDFRKPSLTCCRSKNDCLVELSFLETDGYAVISLIDLYVLHIEDLTKNFLSDEVVDILISQLTDSQKQLALMKYYKEFC